MAAQSEWLPYEISSGSSDASPPHFGELWPAGRPPATSLNGDPIVKSDQRHDPTGREIITLNPPETIAAVGDESARSRSLTQFLPLEKRLFDENDNDPGSPYHDTPMVQFSDGLGRLIRVHEVVRLNDDGTSGGTINEWPTQYRYDLNDNLTQITDSQGNQKWFRYDGLKRKLFMNDPDRGTMTYTYDDASNLRETVDAKAQHIQYTYDGVNRLLAETYLDGLPLPPWRPPSTLNPQPTPLPTTTTPRWAQFPSATTRPPPPTTPKASWPGSKTSPAKNTPATTPVAAPNTPPNASSTLSFYQLLTQIHYQLP
jgi:YD repeat-containing protein